MNSPQPLALKRAGSEWVGGMVVDMAPIQGGVVKDKNPVLATG